MAINVSNVGQVAVAPQLNELKKTSNYTKTNAMPMDSVSFGNGDESEKKSNAGKIAAVVGGIALVAGAIYALTRGKTKAAKEVAEAGAKEAAKVADDVAEAGAKDAAKVGTDVVADAQKTKSIGEMTTAEALQHRAAAVGADGKPTHDALEAQKLLNKKAVLVPSTKDKLEFAKTPTGKIEKAFAYELGEDGKATKTFTYFYGKDGLLEKATVRNGHFGEPISKIKYSKFDDGQGNIIVKAHEQKVGSNEWTVTNVGTVKKAGS